MPFPDSIFRLDPHPQCAASPLRAIEVRVRAAPDGGLRLDFRLRGEASAIRVPPARPPARADGLWAHTCVEAFVAAPGSPAYREFNFSPSGEWAIYDFDAYRQRAADDAAAPAPSIETRRHADGLDLVVHVAAAALPRAVGRHIGLSAVVEARDGSLGYWALRHPAARPDFHHRDGFVLELPSPLAGKDSR